MKYLLILPLFLVLLNAKCERWKNTRQECESVGGKFLGYNGYCFNPQNQIEQIAEPDKTTFIEKIVK
jgi:hypothetical protein